MRNLNMQPNGSWRWLKVIGLIAGVVLAGFVIKWIAETAYALAIYSNF